MGRWSGLRVAGVDTAALSGAIVADLIVTASGKTRPAKSTVARVTP
jgi:hypothetical protein